MPLLIPYEKTDYYKLSHYCGRNVMVPGGHEETGTLTGHI
jgi:hypothetical protein